MKTVTMNISMPESLRVFIDSQVIANAYSGASEYIRELVRRDQMSKQRETKELELLRAYFQEGLNSPVARSMDKTYFEDMKKRILQRAREEEVQHLSQRTFEETHS